jgi:hypothetical protein
MIEATFTFGQGPSSPPGTTAAEGQSFQEHLAASEAGSPASLDALISQTATPIMDAIGGLNAQASALKIAARDAMAQGGALSPGEMIMLSMRCNEFLVQCQLTSNIATRSADGVQQLFREQG